MTRSTLDRLFNYAKAIGADARENFTTEALAAAIREDGAPIVEALSGAGVLPLDASYQVEGVQTQVPMPGAGILDLVIELKGSANRKTIWIEVKVGAGESGSQIDNYLARIAKDDDGDRPQLVILGPRCLRDGVVWLSWQALYRSISEPRQVHAYWRDFRTYLKEINMANDSFKPVRPEEASTIAGAHRLLLKTVQILVPAAGHANKVWPGSNWPVTDQDVLEQITKRFRRWPSYSIEHRTRYPCGLVLGVYQQADAGEALLSLWLWAPPRRIDSRKRILQLADQSKLDSWKRDTGSWELLRAERRLLDFESHDAASAWLKQRLDELKTVGMYAILEQGDLGDGSGEDDRP